MDWIDVDCAIIGRLTCNVCGRTSPRPASFVSIVFRKNSHIAARVAKLIDPQGLPSWNDVFRLEKWSMFEYRILHDQQPRPGRETKTEPFYQMTSSNYNMTSWTLVSHVAGVDHECPYFLSRVSDFLSSCPLWASCCLSRSPEGLRL